MQWQHLMNSLVNLHDVPYNTIQLKVPAPSMKCLDGGKKSLNLIKPPALSVNRKYRAQRNVLQNTIGIQSTKSRTGIILQDKCLGLVNKLQEKGGGLFKLKET